MHQMTKRNIKKKKNLVKKLGIYEFLCLIGDFNAVFEKELGRKTPKKNNNIYSKQLSKKLSTIDRRI